MTRFLVLFTGRAGSSYLISLLKQLPDVVAYYEVLADHESADAKTSFLAKFFSGHPQGCLAYGFKLKPKQLHDPQLFISSVRKHRPVLFCLDRHNKVKQAISTLRARELRDDTLKKYGVAMSNLREQSDRPAAITISRDALFAELAERERRDTELMALIEELQQKVHTLYYEDLLRDPLRVLATAAGILGIEPPERLPPAVVHKNTPDDLRDAVINFDEVEGWLRRTRLHAQLLEGSTRSGFPSR